MLNTQLAYSGSFTSLPRHQETGRPAPVKPAAEASLPGKPQPAEEKQPSKEITQASIKAMNQALQGINSRLEFTQDEQTGRTVVKIIDRETKETIRQIPSEEALAIAHSLDEVKGVLLRQTA